MINSLIEMISNQSTDAYTHRRTTAAALDARADVDDVVSLSSEHAAVIRSILHGRGMFNHTYAIRRICWDTQLPRARVAQLLDEIKDALRPRAHA